MAKFYHFGKYLKNLGNKFKVYLVLGKVFDSLWHNLYAIGQIFIAENGQILKTKFCHLVTLDGKRLKGKQERGRNVMQTKERQTMSKGSK